MLSFSIAGLYKLYMMHPMKLNISNVIKFHLFNLSLTWWYFDFCAKLDLVLHCWLGKVVIFISVPLGNTGSYCWSFVLYLYFRSIFCFFPLLWYRSFFFLGFFALIKVLTVMFSVKKLMCFYWCVVLHLYRYY